MQTGLRILLIEDDPLMADVTSYRLELLGYRVTVSTTVVAVWQAIDRSIPHAILLNFDSEDLDGFGLLEQFASDQGTSEIPVLALSADAELERVERAWKNGARDYLLTPYDPLALEQKVARLFDGIEPQPEISSEPGIGAGSKVATASPTDDGLAKQDEARVLAAIDQAITAELAAAKTAEAREDHLQIRRQE